MDGGIMPFAPSLDHVGPIAARSSDLRSCLTQCSILISKKTEQEDLVLGESPPRLGRLRGFFDRRARPTVTSVLDEAVRALEGAGCGDRRAR